MTSQTELERRLNDVEKAIEAAVTGQSYSLAGTNITRQELPALYDERNRLSRQLDILRNGGSDFKVAHFPWAG